MTITAAVPSQPAPPSADLGDPFSRGDLPVDGNESWQELLPHAVSLDACTGRLVCPRLGLEAEELIVRITQKRLMRVFGQDGYGRIEEENGGALCASENRRVADHGRPGRECSGRENRRVCTPRWRIVHEEPDSRPTFAHTLTDGGLPQRCLLCQSRIALQKLVT